MIFSVSAMICLATSNYMMSWLGDLGLGVVKYYNVGPLFLTSAYFLLKQRGFFDKPTQRRADSRATGIQEIRAIGRTFFYDEDEELDISMIFFVVAAAVM